MKKSFLSILLIASVVISSAQNNKPDDTNTTPIIPVLKTYVPADIVAKAIKKYGRILYCITQIKTTNGEPGYLVGLIRNGRLTTELMEEIKMASRLFSTYHLKNVNSQP